MAKKIEVKDAPCHECPPFTMVTGKLVKRLYDRGVTIRDIFAMYYGIEEMYGNRGEPLTVEDAELAGYIN